jgi:hypothetical protein
MNSFFRKSDFSKNIFRRLSLTKKLRMAKNGIQQSLPDFGGQFGRITAGLRQIRLDQWPDTVRFDRILAIFARSMAESG